MLHLDTLHRLSKNELFCDIKMLWLTILHRNMLKIYIKLVKVKIFVKVWQIHEFSISCFTFICPKFGADSQILHRNMLKNYIKLVKFEKLCQIGQINEFIFSCFTFIRPTLAQILKYFAQSCYCMIAALVLHCITLLFIMHPAHRGKRGRAGCILFFGIFRFVTGYNRLNCSEATM